MANYNPKSLWDDRDDDGYDKKDRDATQRSGSEYDSYRIPSSFRDEPEDDENLTGGYGGPLGYTGYSRYASSSYGDYDYSGAFDDSADSWYQRNSFRYGSRADYSPSSLFRSTWSGGRSSYSSDADTDAQNKAIRALRALTRSANTIIDKIKAGRQDVVVQFSKGADSNGATAQLNDEKQRVVYVSPDALLDTKELAEEDAVIDALTGFVLLRVQMTQDVPEEVIATVNATGAHMAVIRLVRQFIGPAGKKLEKTSVDELRGMAAEVVDACLAGILAKSVLMRLSRRAVVTSWGGFAPYFVRHAKKFAQVKENLEKAPRSLESVVSVLGYNMLVDEDQIEIPKEFEEVAVKHMGEEVALEDLLATCQKMVEDLRKLLAADETAVPGEMESALSEMLEKAQASVLESSKGDGGKMDEFLSAFSESVLGAMDAQHDSVNMTMNATGTNKVREQLQMAAAMERLADRLEHVSEAVNNEKAKIDNPEEHPSNKDVARRSIDTMRANLAYELSSRPQAIVGFTAQDAALGKDFSALATACKPGMTGFSDSDAEKLREKLNDMLTRVKAAAKDKRAVAKTEVNNAMTTHRADFEKTKDELKELVEKVKTARTDISEMSGVEPGEKNAADAMLATILHAITGAMTRAEQAITKMDTDLQPQAAGARSVNTLSRTYDAVLALLSQVQNTMCSTAFTHMYGGHAGPETHHALSEMRGNYHRGISKNPASMQELIEKICKASAERKRISAEAFLAALAEAAGYAINSEEAADEDEDGGRKPRINPSLGDLSEKELAELQRLLRGLDEAGHDATKASGLGKAAKEALGKAQKEHSPVDNELFGAAVEAATKILTGESLGHINDEARNAPEEDYVAYLDSVSAKPTVRTVQAKVDEHRAARTEVVKDVRRIYRGSIEQVRNALQFQNGKRTEETYGLRSGELDEGGLHKLSYDCDHIWAQKTVSKLPDVAVGILVDQSGSMSGGKIDRARTMCIILAEALKKINGVRLYVYGHTANQHYDGMSSQSLTIFEHYTPGSADLAPLGGIRAYCNNYDGYAVKDVAKRLSEDPAKNKHLFVIADGLPAGQGYGGETAEKHVTSVCKFVRERLHISLNAFAVGVPPHQHPNFKKQYGDNHVVFINDIMKCLPQIVRFLRNTLQKEKKLVGVE
jgi:Cobalamin biosynthesis protein CobT VWA domain